jgi:uncharacterized membrane protein YeiB
LVANRLLSPRRLLGVDVARGLALIGMMAVHVVPATSGGGVTSAYLVASGRSAALFAVLAGVSLVLSTRAAHGGLARGARRGLLARAALIAFLGMTLGVLDSGVAVILVNYAVLFAVGALLVGCSTRFLAVAAVVWMLLSPVLGQLVRMHVPPGPGPVPSWFSLGDPLELVTTLLFTGYYPVLQWTAYLLVGMTLAKLPLRRTEVAVGLVAAGAVLAGGAKLVSALLLGPGGGWSHLVIPPSSASYGADLATALATGMYGTTPTSSWWWLAVAGPHTGTPLDLLHTTGTSLLVLGACLLLAHLLGQRGRRVQLLLPIAAAGSMTLTLYAAHVVALTIWPPASGAEGQVWLVHVITAVAVASLWVLTGRRGPLEELSNQLSTAARG